LGLFPSDLHHGLVAHACRIKNAILEFRSSKNNIFVNVKMSSTISKDNIISMLPYIPNSKRKNNLPLGLMPQLVGLIFAIFLHLKLKIILIKNTAGIYAQSMPDVLRERAVSESI